MDNQNQRMTILDMIDQGRISAAEGLRLFEAVSDQQADELGDEVPCKIHEQTQEDFQPAQRSENTLRTNSHGLVGQAQTDPGANSRARENAAEIRKWKHWWTIPLWIGVLITIFGAIFMFQAQQSTGIGFWFVAAMLLFALGVIVIIFAWQSRTAPWLHLRIQQPPGEKPERIAFSLPLPLHQAGWLMQLLSRKFTDLQGQDWGQLLQAIGSSASPENPIIVNVDEGEFGEKVEIFIG